MKVIHFWQAHQAVEISSFKRPDAFETSVSFHFKSIFLISVLAKAGEGDNVGWFVLLKCENTPILLPNVKNLYVIKVNMHKLFKREKQGKKTLPFSCTSATIHVLIAQEKSIVAVPAVELMILYYLQNHSLKWHHYFKKFILAHSHLKGKMIHFGFACIHKLSSDGLSKTAWSH